MVLMLACRRLRPGTEHERPVAFLYRKHAIGSALSARSQSFRSSAHGFAFHFRLSFWLDAFRPGPHRQCSDVSQSVESNRRRCICERIAPTFSRNFRHVRVLMAGSDFHSELCRSVISIRRWMRTERMYIRRRNPEWRSAAASLCRERLRSIVTRNRCAPITPDPIIERKWGERRSAPRDYIFDRPVLLGKMRMGPDLANVGQRAPVTDQNAPPPRRRDNCSTAPGAPADCGLPCDLRHRQRPRFHRRRLRKRRALRPTAAHKSNAIAESCFA